jgi:hypothetical protein
MNTNAVNAQLQADHETDDLAKNFNANTHLDFLKQLVGVSASLSAVKNFFSTGVRAVFPDREIPVNDISLGAINRYKDPHDPAVTVTSSVTFEGPKLLQWLNNIDKGAYDQIRLEFAVYTDEMITAYQVDPLYRGRTTIFIAAYKNNQRAEKKPGTPLDVYNIGHLNP